MPLYEYQCLKCGTLSQKIQKFSDSPLTKCEKCGGKLERLISSPAIQFKGTGWYVTDYARKSSASEPAKSEKPMTDKASAPPGDSPKTGETPAAAQSKVSKPADKK